MGKKIDLKKGIAYVAGFGAGVCGAICVGQVFERIVPEATTEVTKIVRKVGKFGCETVAHDVISNAVAGYTASIIEAGESSAHFVQSMVGEQKA